MTEFCINAYFKAKNFVYDLTHKENGDTNIIAIILVLAIVIVLAIAFRKQIAALFNGIWNGIRNSVNSGSESKPNVENPGDMVGAISLFFM